MLSATDDLVPAPRRILVAGTSGVGKTTLAARISSVLGVPHTEIDALFHGPDWTPRDSFVADVEAFTAEPAWVTEWQYGVVRETLLARADTMVWLDLPLPVAFGRLVRRTVRRRLRREELWNGNVEPTLWSILWDRDHIIRWGMRTALKTRRGIPDVARSAQRLRIVRLGSQSDVDEFLRRLVDSIP
jgi:adenylate kinase family enzyme